MTVKLKKSGDPKLKARYNFEGYQGRNKNMMVHTATTFQTQSIRMLLSILTKMSFDDRTLIARQIRL